MDLTGQRPSLLLFGTCQVCFFLKVAIASDLLLLPYSGAYETLSTDSHNRRQREQGDGESEIPQLKKTVREFQI